MVQRIGVQKLYGDVSVAVEQGDFKKLRVLRDNLGVNLGFFFSGLNDYGCSNINLAVVSQNKPLICFMAESGADLSLACLVSPRLFVEVVHQITVIMLWLTVWFECAGSAEYPLAHARPDGSRARLQFYSNFAGGAHPRAAVLCSSIAAVRERPRLGVCVYSTLVSRKNSTGNGVVQAGGTVGRRKGGY